jgi:hypothetical protein
MYDCNGSSKVIILHVSVTNIGMKSEHSVRRVLVSVIDLTGDVLSFDSNRATHVHLLIE